MDEYLHIPSALKGFTNTSTEIRKADTGREFYLIHGCLKDTGSPLCTVCGSKMHIHDTYQVNLRHLSLGKRFSAIRFDKNRYRCPVCQYNRMQTVPFQADGHRITQELLTYTKDLLTYGFTNKQVCEITGLGKNTVKEIDLIRLKDKYTINGNILIKPEVQARYLGIDEFKLHNGHKFATIVIDLDNGHILYLAHGKKKQVVYDFINHVGLQWMGHVQAIACDMNSDYQEAFEELCPHIQCVYDFFHIKKNFNDKVIGEIRKDERRRLIAQGDKEAAASLKRSKYILTSKKETLKKKDSQTGMILQKGGGLFNSPEVLQTSGRVERYEKILKENKLLFTATLILEKLDAAYKMTDEAEMAQEITEIMDMCIQSKNRHLKWFYHLLDSHFEGIIAHATYRISSGKVEGTNQMIKNVRRQGYGYPDDEYFFLKLFDASRKDYVRNPKSPKICD